MKRFILAVCLFAAACSSWFSSDDGVKILDHAGILAHCQQVGRDAGDGGHIAAYEACKAEAGVK